MSSTGRAAAISCPDRLIDKVDELRKLGLQDRIPLPQIAVMGDQSSGKSSLLEYISGVTFPKDSDFCTCFATEVSMRQSTEFSARILINHCPDDRLKQPESVAEVAEVIETAKKIFIQEHGGNERAGRMVFNEVLTVELSGPGLPMLTLVDLPGYIHTHTSKQPATTVKDIENLAQKYLESPRTIILAVIPVNQDFATNVVIKHVREVDPEGKRTLAVLTKPDMIDAGTEHKVLEILSGKEMPLERGYHLIKNKNYEESKAGEPLEVTSAKEEKFFSRFPWSTVDSNDKGILSLVEKLTDTLSEQVEKEFPSIKREIIEEKEKLEKQLESLGPGIETDLEKANLLQRNVNHVMNQLKSLIDGHYSRVAFPPKYFIRAQIQKFNQKFHEVITNITAARAKSVDISEMMELTRGRELKGMVQFEPFVILCRSVIRSWLCPTNEHIAQVCKLVSGVSADVIKKECDKLLVDYFCERMSEYVALQEKQMVSEASEVHDDELTPMTCQELDYGKCWFPTALLSETGWLNDPTMLPQSTLMAVEVPSSSEQSKPSSKKASDSTLKIPKPDSQEDARIRGFLLEYCRTAAKRYVDAICLYVIERRLFKKCDSRVLEWFLQDKMALSRIRESTQTSRLRGTLPVQISKYNEALARL